MLNLSFETTSKTPNYCLIFKMRPFCNGLLFAVKQNAEQAFFVPIDFAQHDLSFFYIAPSLPQAFRRSNPVFPHIEGNTPRCERETASRALENFVAEG